MNKNIFWGMEERALRTHLEDLESISSMPFTAQEIEAISLRAESAKNKESILSINGDTAEIQIIGILSRTGPSWIEKWFGIKGTAYNEIISSVKEAVDSPMVRRIVLKMNTPGGVMSGVDEVWQEVKNASGKKEVIVENHGLVASAGYYIASAANKIVATSPLGMVGSIGVMLFTYDYTDALKEHGIKKIKIISKNAPEKNPDLATKKGVDVIQKEIDALERVMINRIAIGRNVSDEYVAKNFGRGSVLINKDPDNKNPDAISSKMIDGLLFSENHGNIEEGASDDNNMNSQEEVFSGSTSFNDYEIVDNTWDADAATKRVKEKTGSKEEPSNEYKNAFFLYDSKDTKNFDAYKFPFVDVVDGKMVAIRSGVFAADRAMSAKTGKAPDIQEKDRSSIQSHIDSYKAKIEKQDQKKKEKNAMNSLQEAMDQFPGIKAEVAARDLESEKKGRQSATDLITARINKALPFVGNAAYPPAVGLFAKKVISGEATAEGLDVVIASVDANKEAVASTAAKKETDALPETHGAHKEKGAGESPNGKIEKPEDIAAANEKIKDYL